MRENHTAELAYADDLIASAQVRCTEAASGGHAVDNILPHSLSLQMSVEVLSRMAER